MTEALARVSAEIQKGIEEQNKKSAKDNPKAFKFRDVGVQRTGTQIILPDGMTYEEGIECIKRKQREEEEEVGIHEEVVAHPLDGSYALMCVLKEIFGWAHAAPTPGFFGPNPPTFINLDIGFRKTTQVIWGGFVIPGVDGQLQTSYTRKNGQIIFVIAGEVKQKHRHIVKVIADQVRAYVLSNSVYKGQAVRLMADAKGDLNFDFQYQPQFMDLTNVREEELIFPEEIKVQIETNIFTPIERTDLCRKFKVPLKRGVLLEGKYGTGKTMTANVTAKKCVENGWTFLYLDRVTALKDALLFARQYAPAVIFAEDLDRVVSGERNVKVDDVLNNIDGVDSKNQEIMVVLTTNNVGLIDKGMLRPGRLDAVITVVAPDEKAAASLISLYSRGLLAEGEDLTEAGNEVKGQIPAVIREVVERSKLAAIHRMDADDENLKLKAEDLVLAAKGMQNHWKLMAPNETVEPTPEEKVGLAIATLLKQSIDKDSKKIDTSARFADALANKLGVKIS